MDPLIGYGLVSGVGSLLSGLFNTKSGEHQSKELMDYQYKLQQEAIDRQNFYNSPTEQMKRLSAAGLNPNLVYGSGVDGNQSSAASPSIANVRGQMGNPLQDAAQQYLQAKQMQLNEIKTRNEAFESRERQLNLRAKTLGQLLDNRFMDATLETRVKTLAQGLANDLQQQKNLEANEALTWSKTRNEDNRLQQIWAEVDLLKSRKNLTDQQALTEVVKRASMRAGIRLTNAQIKQAAHMIPYIDAGTDLRGQEYEQKETDFESGAQLEKWLEKHPNVALTKEIIDYIFDKANGKSRASSSSRKGRRSRRRR